MAEHFSARVFELDVSHVGGAVSHARAANHFRSAQAGSEVEQQATHRVCPRTQRLWLELKVGHNAGEMEGATSFTSRDNQCCGHYAGAAGGSVPSTERDRSTPNCSQHPAIGASAAALSALTLTRQQAAICGRNASTCLPSSPSPNSVTRRCTSTGLERHLATPLLRLFDRRTQARDR